MGRKADYQSGLFNELVELNKKMDKLLNENKIQSLTIYTLKLEIDELNKQHQKDQEKIELLIEENEKLKNKNNKNSSNSLKPSSTDMFKPDKTGANLYSSRVKSNNKKGG